MNEIFFPSQYKNALLNRTKNITIRTGNELGKYTSGKVYSAKSYAGRIWNIRIKILNVFSTTLEGLSAYKIPKRSIKALQKNERIRINEKIELLQFRVL